MDEESNKNHTDQPEAQSNSEVKKWLPWMGVATLALALVAATTLFLALPKRMPESEEEKKHIPLIEDAIAPVDCPDAIERNLPASSYQGPLIDTHIHIDQLMDPQFAGNSIAEWICMLDAESTDKVFAFFPVWRPVVDESLNFTKAVMEKYPDRFVPFIGVPDRDGSPDGFPTVDAAELKSMLDVYPSLFKGYGETGLYAREGGAPALPPDSQRLTDIYPLMRENNLIVYFHLGNGHEEAFEKVLEANRDIAFIWHGDQLIECASCPKNLDKIAKILENHPNVYYGVDQLYGNTWLIHPDVTKEQFIDHFSDYDRLLEIDIHNWKGLIERYPDQVLLGTDRGAEWSRDTDVAVTLNDYLRAFIGRLDPKVQEKFAHQNARDLVERGGQPLASDVITRNLDVDLPDTIQHIEGP